MQATVDGFSTSVFAAAEGVQLGQKAFVADEIKRSNHDLVKPLPDRGFKLFVSTTSILQYGYVLYRYFE
jgi:hypothetical protein